MVADNVPIGMEWNYIGSAPAIVPAPPSPLPFAIPEESPVHELRITGLEDEVAELKEQIQALWEKDFPVVLSISGLGETSSAAFDRLRSLVIKAVGADLLKES